MKLDNLLHNNSKCRVALRFDRETSMYLLLPRYVSLLGGEDKDLLVAPTLFDVLSMFAESLGEHYQTDRGIHRLLEALIHADLYEGVTIHNQFFMGGFLVALHNEDGKLVRSRVGRTLHDTLAAMVECVQDEVA